MRLDNRVVPSESGVEGCGPRKVRTNEEGYFLSIKTDRELYERLEYQWRQGDNVIEENRERW